MRLEKKILFNVAIAAVGALATDRYSKIPQGAWLYYSAITINGVAFPLIYKKKEKHYTRLYFFTIYVLLSASHIAGLPDKVNLIITPIVGFSHILISGLTFPITQQALAAELECFNNQTLSKEQFLNALEKFQTLDEPHRTHVLTNVTVKESLSICLYNGEALPKNLTINGDFTAKGCLNLVSLPSDLDVQNSINIQTCPNFATLPDELTVQKNLRICDCAKFTSLPKALTVKGDFHAEFCSSLVSLPSDLDVQSSINIQTCRNFATLPDELTVQKNLRICGCAKFTSLPKALTVKGDFNCITCINLPKLTDDLNVFGHFNLSGCMSLTSLPDWITDLGHVSTESGTKTRNIYLNGTKLPEDTIKHLINAKPEGMKFHFSKRDQRKALSRIKRAPNS